MLTSLDITMKLLIGDYTSVEQYKFTFIENRNTIGRKLDFTKVEKELVCEMSANRFEIQKELYGELENALINNNLLRKEK